MKNNRLSRHLPLFRMIAALFLVLVAIGLALSSVRVPDSVVRLDRESWEWAAAAGFDEAAPPSDGWTPFPAGLPKEKEADYYWVRIPLPDMLLHDPYLWITNTASVRVWADGDFTYTFDIKARNDRINLGARWNLARVPEPLPEAVYLLTTNRSSIAKPLVRLGERSDHIRWMIRKDTDDLVLSALFLFCSFVSLSLYAVRREKLYGYFFLLCFSGGTACAMHNFSLQLLWDYRWITYFVDVFMPLGTGAFLGVMTELFPGIYRKTMIFMRNAMLIVGCVILVAAVWSPYWYPKLILFPFLPSFPVTVIFIIWTLGTAYRKRKDLESIWLLSGFASMAAVSLVHVFRFMIIPGFSPLPGWMSAPMRYFPEDMLFWGLFVFVVCIVRVILHRFGIMNRELEAFNRSLEQKVAYRTQELKERSDELEKANALLAASAKETAETMAETMLLQERRRITGSIHDSVGHALTATIVQLEAAKRLLRRDPKTALDKLNASKQLVRKGLEEIRLSSRIVENQTPEFHLLEAIHALIEETKQSTGVFIGCRLEAVPDSLSMLQKRVLYQALQEGLTNGIRHGESRRFDFSLTMAGGEIVFRLANDGRTYSPTEFGFGLQAMAERVAELGGRMELGPGNPGCILTLALPA
ncbi:sensor histidine kinase [Cohnella massiliensis]|uniref:sensor histidine kinase n=1 Tax=Cohnella massiliensis TaxID=1816691 RepID=UPI001592F3D0|nr:sensor histidine kinase [Cohnella massiliensis]